MPDYEDRRYEEDRLAYEDRRRERSRHSTHDEDSRKRHDDDGRSKDDESRRKHKKHKRNREDRERETSEERRIRKEKKKAKREREHSSRSHKEDADKTDITGKEKERSSSHHSKSEKSSSRHDPERRSSKYDDPSYHSDRRSSRYDDPRYEEERRSSRYDDGYDGKRRSSRYDDPYEMERYARHESSREHYDERRHLEERRYADEYDSARRDSDRRPVHRESERRSSRGDTTRTERSSREVSRDPRDSSRSRRESSREVRAVSRAKSEVSDKNKPELKSESVPKRRFQSKDELANLEVKIDKNVLPDEKLMTDSPTHMEGPSVEAIKETIKMDDVEEKIRQRRERIEQWRKSREEKLAKEGALRDTQMEVEGKKWNLEDEEEDEEDTSVDVKISSVAKVSLKPLLKKLQESENGTKEKPKRTAIFGKPAKAVKGSKAIGFSFKSASAKAPKLLTKSNVILEEDSDSATEDNSQTVPDAINGDVSNERISVSDVQESNKAAVIESEAQMKVDGEAKKDENSIKETNTADMVDPLDSFMLDIHKEVHQTEVEEKINKATNATSANATDTAFALKEDFSDEEEEKDPLEINQADIMATALANLGPQKKKDFAQVDHSKMNYEPFKKDFYVEPPELANLTMEEVDQKRIDLDGIHVRGVRCPKPVEKWTQFGMPAVVQDVIKKVLMYEKPSPIQCQAIPAILSGRDVIGIAKTGSGKTIAFLLPMLRHIKDQRPSQGQEGPIGLIMTPTRELAVQIHRECKYFTKALNLRAVCCYGGSPIKEQIAELKRGADIIICTPGRMIDLLCANSGRVTNLKRVTYLVLDEADRMFDMGFEPQVMKMVNNIRPSRQTVLFSATFPRFMESLARKILKRPLEIMVGARSVVCDDVTQVVEIVEDDEAKFVRLLGILGKAFAQDPNCKVLVFVDRQEGSDTMLSNLFKRGYPCLSLHGGKDQADRDSVLSDFKSGATNILIATSVAARGLDVKELKVVVNYDCPNHMEDYVHRCGRTGRAGNKGTAFTFILPDQASYAAEVVKALEMSMQTVDPDLRKMVDKFLEKVRLGAARRSGTGFSGRGLERLEFDRDVVKRIQMKEHGGDLVEEEDTRAKNLDENGEPIVTEKVEKDKTMTSNISAAAAAPDETAKTTPHQLTVAIAAAKERAKNMQIGAGGMLPAERARLMLVEMGRQRALIGRMGAMGSDAAFWAEVEVNDYPQRARWKVTNKDTIQRISEISGAAITTRGVFIPPGKSCGPGERKLYLFIEGETQFMIDRAKMEIKEVITEATMMSMETGPATIGRYNVLG